MTIYITHSRNYNYKTELYLPLQNSSLNYKYNLISPHELSEEPYNSRDLILQNKCDLVLTEVSQAATGKGIGLGWANAMNIPII